MEHFFEKVLALIKKTIVLNSLSSAVENNKFGSAELEDSQEKPKAVIQRVTKTRVAVPCIRQQTVNAYENSEIQYSSNDKAR